MKHLLSALLLILSAALSAAFIEIRPVEEKIWKAGEEVGFTVKVFDKEKKLLKEGSCILHVTNSNGRELRKPFKVDLASANPLRFSAKLPVPGFLMVRSRRYISADGKEHHWENPAAAAPPVCGVPVEPEKIRTGLPAPADFDNFWRSAVSEFKNAAVKVVPEKDVKLKGFKVSRITVVFPDGTGAIDGYISVPVKAGKYPVIFSVPGAGEGSVSPIPSYSTGKPAIYVCMNVHKFPTAASSAEQKKRFARYDKSFPDKKTYIHSQAHDREKYIFRQVWPALSRAADHVTATVPEYDGRHLVFVGSSQGGATALALSYLNKNAFCAVANVPGFCDHSGWTAGRSSGGPNLHNVWRGKADAASLYFDCAYFASSIRIPVLISAGFADTTCVPSSIYAAFNNLKGRKYMFPMLHSGHIARKDFAAEARKFLIRELGL